jgi:8-oxo-dGTP pyrophosphatase MutT (NUDIX family)
VNHGDELWQEYTDNGEAIAGVGFDPLDRSIDHSEKVRAASYVWFWRKNIQGELEILLQLRAIRHVYYKFWDATAAGHINLNESSLDAILRETREEINFDVDGKKLYFVTSVRTFPPSPYKNMISSHFLYKYSGENEAVFRFNDGEVAQLEWFSLDELKKWVKNPKEYSEKLVPHASYCWGQLFACLENISQEENER